MSNNLTVIKRAEIALESSKTAQQLTELAASTKGIVAVSNRAGRQECHAAAMAATNARTSIKSAAKTAREDATAFSKAVIAEEKRLIDIIEPEENRLKALRDEYDAKIEAERAAKAEAERKRIATIHDRIAAIRFAPKMCAGQTANMIDVVLDATEAIVIDDSFGEFVQEAAAVKAHSIAELNALLESKEIAEAEERRIAIEKAAEKKRMEEERAALAAERAKITKEKLAAEAQLLAERMEFERERSEILAENARIADEQKALDQQMREELARQEAEESDRQKRQELNIWKEERDADLHRRAQLSALTPPTLQQITRLVADHFADGDYATAERWIKELL